jgi:ABC-type uncharacterized transport system permease subunit
VKDFLEFRTMITPIIIQIIFWLGVAACIVMGLIFIVAGIKYDARSGVAGFAILILGPVVVRIYCEILIIFFRINETLMEIKHDLEERRVALPAPAPSQTPPPAA